MREYSSAAVVLDKENNGDFDSRVFIFTEKFGKLSAKAKSSRKITSKLSAHLEPGNLIQARLVEKNGLQVVDALKKERLKISPADLYLLNKVLAEAEPETIIWTMLAENKFYWRNALKTLGWDPAEAGCFACGGKPACFYIKEQDFLCKNCALKLLRDEVIYF